MKKCCTNCKNRFDAHKTDFTKLNTDEPIDSILDGFICMAFASEGVAYWMLGVDEDKGICEMYKERSRR